MASFHKLTVIGRLVGDPEVRTFANGGKVAKIGLPINFTQRKKNPATGQWEGESFIISVDCFNRERGQQLADLVSQYLRKGSSVYVEGRLKPNEYTDRNGKQVFRPVLVADTIQFLDPRQDGSEEAGGMSRGQGTTGGGARPQPQRSNQPPHYDDGGDPDSYDPPQQSTGEEIPF